jgi:hypothetical protein
MAWIESHQELGRHPKTRRFARYAGVTVPAAVGHLHFLWWWALDYAQDGEMTQFDPEDVADAALWDGDAAVLLDALTRAGFLDREGEGLFIHDWGEYAGRLAAQREATREKTRERTRKYRERVRDAAVTCDATPCDAVVTPCDAPTVPNSTPPNITQPNQENVLAHANVGVEVLPSGFDAFWECFPRKVSKRDAIKAWRQTKAHDHTDAIMASLALFIRSPDWQKDGGQYIPYPATWLRGRRWEDEMPLGAARNPNPYFAMLEGELI